MPINFERRTVCIKIYGLDALLLLSHLMCVKNCSSTVKWLHNKNKRILYDVTTSYSVSVTSSLRFCYRSDENPVIVEVLAAILALPEETHPMMRYTALHLIGELCEWIEQHPQVLGECADPVLSPPLPLKVQCM